MARVAIVHLLGCMFGSPYRKWFHRRTGKWCWGFGLYVEEVKNG